MTGTRIRHLLSAIVMLPFLSHADWREEKAKYETQLAELRNGPKPEQYQLAGKVISAQPDLGMNVHTMNRQVARQLRAAGIRAIRKTIYWHQFEPLEKPGEYNAKNLTKLDAEIQLMLDEGLDPLLLVHSAPNGLGYDKRREAFERFADFMAFLAKRYPKVRYWELWNEMDVAFTDLFGAKRKDVPMLERGKLYAEMLKLAYPRIKKANPKAIIVTGGMTNWTDFPKGIYAGGGGKYFDIMNIHTYGVPLEWSFITRGVSVRRLMDANGDREKPIWNTEYGISANDMIRAWGKPDGDPGTYFDDKQKQMVMNCIRFNQQTRLYSRSFVYVFHDTFTYSAKTRKMVPMPAGQRLEDYHFGMTRSDGVTARPVFEAIARHNKSLPSPEGKQTLVPKNSDPASTSRPGDAKPAFPTNRAMLKPSRWKSNSSGSMSTRFDAADQAVVFSVKFPAGVDRWMYPKFTLQGKETLNGAEAVSFDLKILPQEDYQGMACANVMLSPNTPGMFGFSAPNPGEWHSITIKLQNEKDTTKEEVTTFCIGMNPKHDKHSFAIRNLRFSGTPRAKPIAPAIRTSAPGTVWLEHESPTFTITTPLARLAYVLTDWHGVILSQGTWPGNGDSPLVFPPMQPGYYTLATTHDGNGEPLPPFTFAVVVDPKTRPQTSQSFFGVDSAQSWLASPGSFSCPYFDGDSYLLVSELIYRAGIPHVRDRLSWTGVNGTPDSQSYTKYIRNADLLHERGILISSTFHDAPAWTDKRQRLPRDLRALFRFCKQATEIFGNRMGDWEFWNEQDGTFAPDPVWDYAACMKAAYLGFKAGRPDIVVAPGAVCAVGRNAYDEGMYANGMAKYCEIMNFHTYAPLGLYPKMFAEMRKFMADHGMGGRQLWITESGTNAEGRSHADSVRRGFKRHNPEQEMVLAEFLPKSQILMMMEGVARNYYFVFPPYNEADGAKDWGLMRRDGSVKPGYSSFATLTGQLVQARLLGEIDLHDKVRAFVFEQPDGSQTLVFWSISALDTASDWHQVVRITDKAPLARRLAVSEGSYTLTDMLGSRQTIQAVNGQLALRATRYPAYVAGLKGLKPNRNPSPTGRVEQRQPDPDEDLSVIVRLDLNPEDFEASDRKTVASLSKLSGRVRLQVWNLEPTTKSGQLLVDGGTLEGLPETITIPPMNKAELDLVYTPKSTATDGLENSGCKTTLTITGTFNGKSISRFQMPVFMFGTFLANCHEVPLDTTRPENWRPNDSATTTSITFDKAENAIRFDLVWEDDADRWFYPEHVLKLPEESFAGTGMLAFEVKSRQDKVENDFGHNMLMLTTEDVHEGGPVTCFTYSSPLIEWETRYIPLDNRKISLKSVRMFRLGGNPRGKKLTFWLRNLRLLKPGK